MKKKITRRKGRVTRRKRAVRRGPPRPRNVYRALQRLVTLAGQVRGRADVLDNALQNLREQERFKMLRDLLLAMRETSAGNLLASPPDSMGEKAPDATVKALLEALVETFGIKPVHNIGDWIPVRVGRIPDGVELDRPIGDYGEECTGVEVTAVGWNHDGKVLVKPIGRPVVQDRSTVVSPTGVDDGIEAVKRREIEWE